MQTNGAKGGYAHAGTARGAATIGLRVGAVLNAHKVGKHFETEITDTDFTYRRKTDAIAEGGRVQGPVLRMDGFYVIRTSVPEETLDDTGIVRAYKSLAKVERAFRTLKGVDLRVLRIHHWLEPRVRAHVFLCMLSSNVEWHMRQRLAPMLYHDADPAAAEAERDSIVAPAVPSPSAQAEARTGTSDVGTPVMSFCSLMADLATIARNTVSTMRAQTITSPSPPDQPQPSARPSTCSPSAPTSAGKLGTSGPDVDHINGLFGVD